MATTMMACADPIMDQAAAYTEALVATRSYAIVNNQLRLRDESGRTLVTYEVLEPISLTGINWVAIGDRNYGEGSSREHAAMEPRFRGGLVVLARSFARIHETNAKKQGLLPLTFADPDTYDLIGEDDRISVLGLPPVPGENVQCQIVKPDGTTIDFEATHTFSDEQVEWFTAGSALNIVRQKVAAES